MTPCTPGCEWMCATARSYECHCKCGGTNHGRFKHLLILRNDTGPWTSQKARAVLREAQDAAAHRVAPR